MSGNIDLKGREMLKRQFEENGFVVLHDILPPDLVARMQETSASMMRSAEKLPDSDGVYDFEPPVPGKKRAVQRIKKPHQAHPLFMEAARSPDLLDMVEALIGPAIRLHHSKINVKMPDVGSPLEWHQDWAFIPHTNLGLAFVSIALDECTLEKGPLLLLPGSHKTGLRDHFQDGLFFGAIDTQAEGLDLTKAVPVLGPPGTVSIHHPLTIHGSARNHSQDSRRLLFYEYAAADAWPLFYGVDWQEFDSRLVRGESTNRPRLEPVEVQMPYPSAGAERIYALQQSFAKKYFAA